MTVSVMTASGMMLSALVVEIMVDMLV